MDVTDLPEQPHLFLIPSELRRLLKYIRWEVTRNPSDWSAHCLTVFAAICLGHSSHAGTMHFVRNCGLGLKAENRQKLLHCWERHISTPSTHLSLLSAMQASSTGQDAWQIFVERYRHVIVEWCMRRGVPTQTAEDLTQEILIRIYRFLPSYDPAKGKFRTWLGSIIRNQVADYLRRERPVEGEPKGGDDQMAFLDALQNSESVDELVVSVDTYVDPRLAAAMRSAQDRVDPKSWTVFEQTVIHGRTVADVADEVGISKGAAHMAKRRTLDLVRTACQTLKNPQPSPSDIEPSHESDYRGGT